MVPSNDYFFFGRQRNCRKNAPAHSQSRPVKVNEALINLRRSARKYFQHKTDPKFACNCDVFRVLISCLCSFTTVFVRRHLQPGAVRI